VDLFLSETIETQVGVGFSLFFTQQIFLKCSSGARGWDWQLPLVLEAWAIDHISVSFYQSAYIQGFYHVVTELLWLADSMFQRNTNEAFSPCIHVQNHHSQSIILSLTMTTGQTPLWKTPNTHGGLEFCCQQWSAHCWPVVMQRFCWVGIFCNGNWSVP
jgi:hypothetical protein